MKTITKKIMLVILAFCAFVFAMVGVLTRPVQADDTQTPKTFEDAEFTMKEGASVRIGSKDDDGEEFDYTKNGIRFMAKMSIEHYEDIKDDATITYGILIAPKDYHDEAPLNEKNVFGEKPVYNFTGVDGTKIANITTEKLAPIDEDNDGVTDYYGYYASMVNLKEQNITRQFVAVCYMVKTIEDKVTGDKVNTYRFCNDNLSSRSMAYVAQKACENEAQPFKENLTEMYITDQKTPVTFEYEKTYDGEAATSSTIDIELPLDSNVSADVVKEQLISAGFIDGTFELRNANAVEGKKVYADGMTEVSKLTFNAAEAEETDYDKLKGFYKTEDGKELVLTANKTVEVDGAQAVSYKLYADGTVKTTLSGKTTFGSYDLENGKFSLTVDSSVLDFAEVLELDSKIYSEIANTYSYDGKLIKLNKDATLVYDVDGANEQNGVYVLCYNESDNKYYIVINAGSVVITKEITENAGVYTIADFETINFATKEQYSAIAEYYSCNSTGDYLNKVFKFNTDGTILVDGADAGTFVLLTDGDNINILATINDVEMTGTVSYNAYSYGYVKSVVNITDADSVSLALVHEKMATYNPYDIFAQGTSGRYYGTGLASSSDSQTIGRATLFNEKTEIATFKEGNYLGADGKTKYYKYQYRIEGWGTFMNEENSAYCLIPTYNANGLSTGGTANVVYLNGSTVTSKNFTYGIDENGNLFLNVTWDPTGNSGCYGKFTMKPENLPTIEEKSPVELFASAEGTLYHHGNAWYGVLTLYNSQYDDEWYLCRYDMDGNMTDSNYTWKTLKYKMTEMVNGVGTITIEKTGGGSVTHKYGITNGLRWIDMRKATIHSGTNSNYPTVSSDFNMKTFNNTSRSAYTPAINEQVENYAKVYENIGSGASAVVETVNIYDDIAGRYVYNGHYDGSTLTWALSITLGDDSTGDDYTSSFSTNGGAASDAEAKYRLEPITDSYGRIIINHDGLKDYHNNYGADTIGYYSKINGEYVIRIMLEGQGTKYWHFAEFTKETSTFSTWDVFKKIEGKTYTGDAELVLNKMTDTGTMNKVGAKFVFIAGETEVNGTYDFVPTSLTAGKIFMDFNSDPVYYNPNDVDRYVIGEYAKFGDNYVISFTYKGVDYVVSEDDSAILSMIKGDYKGVNASFTIGEDATVEAETVYTGKVTMGEITAKYVIEDNRIIVTYKTSDNDDVILVKAR